MNMFKLNLKYRLAQQRLVNTARDYGLHDPRTVAQSKRVDKLVNQLQRGLAR